MIGLRECEGTCRKHKNHGGDYREHKSVLDYFDLLFHATLLFFKFLKLPSVC
jgi:hypothetical protein